MTTNTSSFAKALWPGVNAWYGKAYDEYPVEWDQIFDKFTSTRNWEEDVGVSSLGLTRVKPEGASIEYDTEKQGFTTRYVHVVCALGFVITREAFEDDQYDVVGPRKAQGLAFGARQTKEIVGANVYNRAFSSSFVFGDGVSLINSAHPNIAGGTASNVIGTAADLSEASLEQALIDISGYTNDRGLRIAVKAKQLIVPKELDFEADKILQTEYEVGTNNNTKNIVRGRLPAGKTMNHYLTDTDAWFLRTNVPHGMKYFERRADEFGMDNDFDTENAKFKMTSRFSFGATDWRGIYGSAGA
jgi:phage major head subunit gpT-like protein